MNEEELHSLTKKLISIDSVTGSEIEIVDFLVNYLSGLAMTVKTLTVDGRRRNILAAWEQEPPRILFNTHMDTVPVQYGPHEDSSRIYGRGACDTHGVLAAQLQALCQLHQSGIAGLGILLVVGEETVHDGASSVKNSKEIVEPDVLIVGEPTENKLMKSQKGRLKGEIRVHGVEGHSGYPEACDSALRKLVRVLDGFWNATWIKDSSAEGTTLNVIIPEAGDADNKVPGFARARLMFRCQEPCSVIKRKSDEIIDNLKSSLPRQQVPDVEMVWDLSNSEPIKSLSILPGFKTGTASFNTDIGYFGWESCRTFLLGPGSILNAHRDLEGEDWLSGEWILKDEQLEGVRLYQDLVRAVLRS